MSVNVIPLCDYMNRSELLTSFRSSKAIAGIPSSTARLLAIPHTVKDLSGNALADFTSQFTTVAAFDMTPRRVRRVC